MKIKSSKSKNLRNPLIRVICDSDYPPNKALKGRFTIAMGISPSFNKHYQNKSFKPFNPQNQIAFLPITIGMHNLIALNQKNRPIVIK